MGAQASEIAEESGRFFGRAVTLRLARDLRPWFVERVTPTVSPEDRVVEMTELREMHAKLRLLDDGLVRGMRESLMRHGQPHADRGGARRSRWWDHRRPAGQLGPPLE